MFNRLFGQKQFSLSYFARKTRLQGWTYDIVEQERPIDQQDKAQHLQPLEGLPSERERDQPNEQGAAGVDRAARGRGDRPGDGEAEEVEAAGDSELVMLNAGKTQGESRSHRHTQC